MRVAFTLCSSFFHHASQHKSVVLGFFCSLGSCFLLSSDKDNSSAVNVTHASPPAAVWPSALTLDLRLVHHEVVVVAAALKLLARASLQTLVLVLHVVEGEHGSGQAAAASLSGQGSQRLLLLCTRRITTTRSDVYEN